MPLIFRAKTLQANARSAMQLKESVAPYLSLLRTPQGPLASTQMGPTLKVVSYNVHRWTGRTGRGRPDPEGAMEVMKQIGGDIYALQEVLRPAKSRGFLEELSDALGMHLAFAVTRNHKLGELGNAILSRYPFSGVSVLDISLSRLERRGALAAQFNDSGSLFGVVATHLSLVDRTRHQQVKFLLRHPQLNAGPSVLVGDMNAWRSCKASKNLDDTLERHNNVEWPPTFPALRPLFSLDRIYAKNAAVVKISSHNSKEARKASDHLPLLAQIRLEKDL